MNTYEPGTVAVATVRGVDGVRVFRMRGFWVAISGGYGKATANDHEVTDIRPLVVLDLDDAAKLLGDLNWAANTTVHIERDARLRDLHMQIATQTKPPRIPEPGLWGVVQSEGRNYFRTTEDTECRWRSGDYTCRWDDLIDPVLIREGVSES